MRHNTRSKFLCPVRQALLRSLNQTAEQYVHSVDRILELLAIRDSLLFEKARQHTTELHEAWDAVRREYERHCAEHRC